MSLFSRLTLLSLLPIGVACAESMATVAIELRGTRYTAEQAFDPERNELSVPAMQRIVLSQDGRYRIESNTVYPGGIRFHFAETGDRDGAVVVDLIRWRTGDIRDRIDATRAQRNRADAAFLDPAWLQVRAQEQAGKTLSIIDDANRPATLIVDTEGTVVGAQSANFRYEYSQHQLDGSIKSPRYVRVFAGERLIADWQLSQQPVKVNDNPFAVPNNYHDATERGDLRVTPLGQQLYRIDGSPSSYHMAFIVGRDSVMLFDAPFAKAEAERVKALVDQTAGGKPISHIIVSHAHRDHIAALPVFDHAGLHIISGKKNQLAISRQHGTLAAQQRLELTAPLTIDVGARRITVYPVNNSHADGMLVAYDETTKTVFQGDLFMMPEQGSVVPAFDVSVELLNFLRDSSLAVTSLISVHGRVAQMDELRQSVALRKQ